MDEDTKFLKKTLGLAKKGMGWVNPNPMVGAIIVKDGQVIAKGYHKKYGAPHAEVEAITHVRSHLERLNGATLYVNLEPCSHFGKNPPCADAIIRAGIKKVVCSSIDPNPQVEGKGIKILRDNGIEVKVGVLEKEARKLNTAFFTYHEKKRPYIALKFASSLDGKIATYTGDSKWVTNEQARNFARGLRGEYQAVLVGVNTVIADDPHLGVRIEGRKDPLRIVLDPKLRIPLKSQFLRDNNFIIVTTSQAEKNKKETFLKKGVELMVFENEKIPMAKLLNKLANKGIISVLVEGGGQTLGNFVDSGLVDKVYAFYAPILIGGNTGISAIGGMGVEKIIDARHLKNILFKRFDDNFLVSGEVRYSII